MRMALPWLVLGSVDNAIQMNPVCFAARQQGFPGRLGVVGGVRPPARTV